MLRHLTKSDLNQILAIEESVHVVPWTRDTFKICFDPGYVGFAVELEKKVIAFLIATLRRSECHILNVCVAVQFQHQGFGSLLLQHAFQHAKNQGAGIIYLEVRRSNSRAISLYRKLKFHLIGERKDYYPTIIGKEDALIFAKTLHEVVI